MLVQERIPDNSGREFEYVQRGWNFQKGGSTGGREVERERRGDVGSKNIFDMNEGVTD